MRQVSTPAEARMDGVETSEVVAFVGVHVVAMDADRILAGQTVIVRGERIEAVGPMSSLTVPEGAFRWGSTGLIAERDLTKKRLLLKY